MIVVSDTSSITSLLQIEALNLLEKLYREVFIHEAVRGELLRNHKSLPSFLRCERVNDLRGVQRLLAEINLGEAEAIILAKERGSDVLLIDELDGRRVAQREGLPIIGSLGVLVEAKQVGLIESVRKLTEDLERVADFRLSDEIKAIAYRKAHEL